MSTFSWDNYMDLIVYPDGKTEVDEPIAIPEEDYDYDIDKTIESLLEIIREYPDNAEVALRAMNRLKEIMFDLDENPDDYEEYE